MVSRSGCTGCRERRHGDRALGRRPHVECESIGEGVAELKINRGPGYRIYFGWDGKTPVILLGGGTKRRQQNDIQAALRRWRDYKKRKR
jgi:putative addiction module killer protein